MPRYEIEVCAYQTVEVEADSIDEACKKALDIGIDTGSAEWECRDVYEYDGYKKEKV